MTRHHWWDRLWDWIDEVDDDTFWRQREADLALKFGEPMANELIRLEYERTHNPPC